MMIAAGGYVVFNESQFGFSLGADGDQVYLLSGDGVNLTGYSHGFAFSGAEQNVSFGRIVTSAGDEYFPRQISRTFGAQNSGPLVGPRSGRPAAPPVRPVPRRGRGSPPPAELKFRIRQDGRFVVI